MENIFNLCNLRLIDLMQNINSLNKSIKRQETEKWTKDICRRKAEESIDM